MPAPTNNPTPRSRILALYIGSSIGNFSPEEANTILRRLRSHLQPGDALLLGADLAPSAHKPIATILAAYDDAAGVTAAFNLNILRRLNRDLDADLNLAAFAHRARWNRRPKPHRDAPRKPHPTRPSTSPAKAESTASPSSLEKPSTPKTATVHRRSPHHPPHPALAFTPTRTFHDPTQSFALTWPTPSSRCRCLSHRISRGLQPPEKNSTEKGALALGSCSSVCPSGPTTEFGCSILDTRLQPWAGWGIVCGSKRPPPPISQDPPPAVTVAAEVAVVCSSPSS